MNRFGKVAVLMGGWSAERTVSLKSGAMVLEALKSRDIEAYAFDPAERPLSGLVEQSFDRAFIALHGRFGEDGTVQGALELLGIPYTGSGVLGSALAMDKWRTKLVWHAAGVPTPRCELLSVNSDLKGVAARLGLPVMVKPANEGSSIGMSKARDAAQLDEAFTLAANYDSVVIAEQCIDGPELTVGILGGEALPVIRLETPRDFYDYQAKYHASDTRYLIPSGLPPEAESAIQREALRAFSMLGCQGWGRVDLMLDGTGTPQFLEVNTSPGMTDHSLVPMAARNAGLSFEDLCVRILELTHVG
ncbi:MAG: D-alanine--D-alanine ligase [Betaproteobacteria bacterium RIFCSPLOWO2_12_FULL_63_13]|nr:MAG: D-alanine--D-alanine ligase [Betaproteobacteria bacterium RIFCSPLOWO2_02_FULL_63_19]OGA53467.1 MAG: D-alanine--D-alanine ligase [Betaproteobacteria bacterium RIFCSPLOWO2_12_FULL_63_13]